MISRHLKLCIDVLHRSRIARRFPEALQLCHWRRLAMKSILFVFEMGRHKREVSGGTVAHTRLTDALEFFATPNEVSP
jgi:hypothetical protein